jgi:tetratricopeptide (TPR) repeat protein
MRDRSRRSLTPSGAFTLLLLFTFAFTFTFTFASDLSARPNSDVVRAKALFERAEVHFNVGEFKKALDLYSKAFKTKQLPAFLFNIAQCHRYLKEYDLAIFFYKRFLSQKPSSPHRTMVEGFIEQCERAREEAARQPEQPTTPSAPERPAERPPTISFEEAVREAPADHDQRGGRSPILLWTGIGVSAALLAGGTVTAVIAGNQNSEYKDSGTSVDRRLELRDSGRPLGVAAMVMLGVGGAAAVGTGLYYFLTYRGAGAESEAPAVSIAPLPEGGGAVVVGGSF